MKMSIAIVHYPHRSICENITFFAENGFDVIEFYGPDFYDTVKNSESGKVLAETLQKNKVTAAVHHMIPKPDNKEACERFYDEMKAMKKWQKEYGLLEILSFDVWIVDRTKVTQMMQYAIDTFAGTGTKIAFEDFPLNTYELIKSGLNYTDESGILMDFGHTNARLCATGPNPQNCFLENKGEGAPLTPGDNSVEAFRMAFIKKPLPVYELHLHNNNGKADEHDFIEHGTADFRGVAKMLKEVGFQGIATLEMSPALHGKTGVAADKATIESLNNWKTWVKEAEQSR